MEPILEAEMAFERAQGRRPTDLSNANPGPELARRLRDAIRLPPWPDPVDYIYGNAHDTRPVLRKLGIEDQAATAQFYSAPTNAIVEAVRWLASEGHERLAVIQPQYFTSRMVSRPFGLSLVSCPVEDTEAGLALPPVEAMRALGASSVFITNPVYSTGHFLTARDVRTISRYLDAGMAVILDECLTRPGRTAASALEWRPNLLGIYAPHKSIYLNAVKFAVLVTHAASAETHNRWSFAFQGGLSAAGDVAIRHFSDPNFDELEAFVMQGHARVYERLVDTFHDRPGYRLLAAPDHHFATVCVAGLPSGLFDDPNDYGAFVNVTGATLLPGTSRYAPAGWGFNYRLNLGRADDEFWQALERTNDYLDALCQDSVGARSSAPVLTA